MIIVGFTYTALLWYSLVPLVVKYNEILKFYNWISRYGDNLRCKENEMVWCIGRLG